MPLRKRHRPAVGRLVVNRVRIVTQRLKHRGMNIRWRQRTRARVRPFAVGLPYNLPTADSAAGQHRGAEIGTVGLRVGDEGDAVALEGGAWLGDPGGAPDGYLHYADDAFAVDFTLPGTLDVGEATPAALSLDIDDLAQMALDGDPATAVDWGSGHWLRYEGADGAQGDAGGVDCSFRPFVAPAAGAAAPANEAPCGASFARRLRRSRRRRARRARRAGDVRLR